MTLLARELIDSASQGEQFEAVGPFGRDGIASALSSEPFGWTHIRWDGRPLYPQRYMRVDAFFEGAAAVQRFADKASAFHIDTGGTPLYRRRFHSVGRFRGGLATVSDDTGCFHIRKDGTPLSNERFALACEFSDGFAFVRGLDGAAGLLDINGRFAPQANVGRGCN